jgi:hypothetical protein
MKSTLIASVVLVLAVATPGFAQEHIGSTSPAAHYTRTQLSQLIRDAHTQEQYETLATYYRGKQTTFSEEASQEKQEWIRRSQTVVLINAKYPRPVDSARYLYEYYVDQARRTDQLATKYEQLAVTATPAVPK